MTQEEKELLLKDLCARLYNGVKYDRVKVHCEWNLFQGDRISEDGELVSINIHTKSIYFKRNCGWITEIPFNRIGCTVLPYLRPMSSMTENEMFDFHENGGTLTHCVKYDIDLSSLTVSAIDWFNAHHFDYRGLIEKGLALEAPVDMYK